MKQLALCLLLSIPFIAQASPHVDRINLGQQNEMLRNTINMIDGHVGMIDGNIFGLMLTVRNKIQNIQLGDRDSANRNNRIGHYHFNGKPYSIAELAQIENQYPNNAELEELLPRAKNDFENLVAEFIGSASGTKSFLIILIEESCNRRNRSDSLLLTWAEAKEGHETIIFRTKVQTFKDLNNFCQDLNNFLVDLMYSCPKAKALFTQMKEHQK